MKQKILLINLFLLPLMLFQACGQTVTKKTESKTNSLMENKMNTSENPYYSRTSQEKLTVSDAEWKKYYPKIYTK